ncbi:hypothetical protein ACFXHA_10480 [Nocardia sp. NPDC059240]|uniref:hypothetical protein n=1 Tax=Nocardia sp. NPDC059240 TaxID=3346786 RepID=UPI0036C0BC68
MSRADYERRMAQRREEVQRLSPAALREHRRLAPPVEAAVLVTVGVAASGALTALWSTPAGREAMRARTVGQGGAIFPDARTTGGATVYVTTQTSESTVVTALEDPGIAHPIVQALSDGGLLLAGARCRWNADTGAQHNAVVYDAEGSVVRTGTLGDGINRIVVTPTDRIWVGYFDEGVIGNYGWGRNGTPEPIGASGLLAFDLQLQPEWRYRSPENIGPITDCYALNAVDETVWASYYTDFPIVSVADGQVTAWNNQITGAAHLLVAPDHTMALVGGSPGQGNRISAGRLGPSSFDVTNQYRLTMPDGSEPPRETHLIGRGQSLHAIVNDRWYRLDLDTLI